MKIPPQTSELPAVECLKNYSPVTTLAPLFLIGSSSFLHVTRTTIKFRLCSKFGKIGTGTEELAAPEHLKKSL